QPPAQNLMDRLGIASTNRNIYGWRAGPARTASGTIILPNQFEAAEITSFLRNSVLPEVVAAAGNLAKISNTNFTLSLSTNETAVAAVIVDYGDILLLRSALNATEYFVYTVNAWNLSAQLKSIFNPDRTRFVNVERLISDYPQFLTFN